MERIIKFRPAFDKRHDDPKKNYGIGAVMMHFGLMGDEGAVSFTLSTGWYLKPNREEIKEKHGFPPEPMGFSVGYHSPKPIRDFQKIDEPSQESCEYLDGKPCWFDDSALYAVEVMEILIRDGEEAMWAELEKYYNSTFTDTPA